MDARKVLFCHACILEYLFLTVIDLSCGLFIIASDLVAPHAFIQYQLYVRNYFCHNHQIRL